MGSRRTVAENLNFLVTCHQSSQDCIPIRCLDVEDIICSEESLGFLNFGDIGNCVLINCRSRSTLFNDEADFRGCVFFFCEYHEWPDSGFSDSLCDSLNISDLDSVGVFVVHDIHLGLFIILCYYQCVSSTN